ncbi:hypothetical protein TNCV_3684231 [Trichonephila clavipes]|uniref:Uncharacterized protein n=1 Tax=Trichonephila clavipes TaxID=2585209 RepID=A0A8X6UWF8_TRICX|nr:hypothetical protein TNCV_3684231 [Trichonephila clavipes]
MLRPPKIRLIEKMIRLKVITLVWFGSLENRMPTPHRPRPLTKGRKPSLEMASSKGPRNFEPRSRDEDDTWALTSHYTRPPNSEATLIPSCFSYAEAHYSHRTNHHLRKRTVFEHRPIPTMTMWTMWSEVIRHLYSGNAFVVFGGDEARYFTGSVRTKEIKVRY